MTTATATATYELPDGTALEEWDGGDPPRGYDPVSGRTLTYDREREALVDGDKIVRKIGQPAARPMAAARKPSKAATGRQARERAGDRFATLNAFVDVVARHLSTVEIAVWVVLFRDCRDGTATASNRDLCHRTGCSLRAVTAAMKRLRAVGLLEPVKLSRHRGEPSTYSIKATPADCLPALTGTGATDAPVRNTKPTEPMHGVHRSPK